MERDEALAGRWEGIANDTDVVVVHTPPYGCLDRTGPEFGNVNAGSRTLRAWISRCQPPLVICGHIHEGFGVDRIGTTAVYNVAYLDEHYEHDPGRRPIVLDLDEAVRPVATSAR